MQDVIEQEQARAEQGCQRCGGPGIPWVFGMPGRELFEAAGRGEVVLGGCCPPLDPTCEACGAPLDALGWYAGVDEESDDESDDGEQQPDAPAALRPTDEQIRHAESVAQRVARKYLRGGDCEGIGEADVVQEVLLRFAQLDLAGIANPDAWVTTVTRNRCADVRAAADRHDQRALDGGPVPDEVQVDAVRDVVLAAVGPSAHVIPRDLVAHVLADLSERERTLLLWHGDGWSNAEIAARFGFASAQSAAVAISRAKQKVRQRFASPSERAEILDRRRNYPVL